MTQLDSWIEKIVWDSSEELKLDRNTTKPSCVQNDNVRSDERFPGNRYSRHRYSRH